jgi:hypothetical protein
MCDICKIFGKLCETKQDVLNIDHGQFDKNYKSISNFSENISVEKSIPDDLVKLVAGLLSNNGADRIDYRNDASLVTDDSGKLLYVPPLPDDLNSLIGDFLRNLNDEISRIQRPFLVLSGFCCYDLMVIMSHRDISADVGILTACIVLRIFGLSTDVVLYLFTKLIRDSEEFFKKFLEIGPNNFYERKFDVDVTPFILLFCQKILQYSSELYSGVISNYKCDASQKDFEKKSILGLTDEQVKLLEFFRKKRTLTSTDLENVLSVPNRQARELCHRWTKSGFLLVRDSSKRARRYGLGKKFEKFL